MPSSEQGPGKKWLQTALCAGARCMQNSTQLLTLQLTATIVLARSGCCLLCACMMRCQPVQLVHSTGMWGSGAGVDRRLPSLLTCTLLACSLIHVPAGHC